MNIILQEKNFNKKSFKATSFRLFSCYTILTALMLFTFSAYAQKGRTNLEKSQINDMLDSFNVAAARADYKAYFNFFDDDAIFTGTDATERWNKKEFMVWAKPYFDKGKTWNLKSLQRHIYFDKTGNFAWFDELLNTQMKICRGSGVLVKKENNWKIKQYILSVTVPNELLDSVKRLKSIIEDSIIYNLQLSEKRKKM